MNVGELKKWLASLPPEFDSADVESVVGRCPSYAKRVVAYRYKDGGGIGVVVNSMGTHLSDEVWDGMEIVSICHNPSLLTQINDLTAQIGHNQQNAVMDNQTKILNLIKEVEDDVIGAYQRLCAFFGHEETATSGMLVATAAGHRDVPISLHERLIHCLSLRDSRLPAQNPEESQFEAGKNLAEAGRPLPDLASDAAKAGAASVETQTAGNPPPPANPVVEAPTTVLEPAVGAGALPTPIDPAVPSEDPAPAAPEAQSDATAAS
jgi:hypothetical protein